MSRVLRAALQEALCLGKTHDVVRTVQGHAFVFPDSAYGLERAFGALALVAEEDSISVVVEELAKTLGECRSVELPVEAHTLGRHIVKDLIRSARSNRAPIANGIDDVSVRMFKRLRGAREAMHVVECTAVCTNGR